MKVRSSLTSNHKSDSTRWNVSTSQRLTSPRLELHANLCHRCGFVTYHSCASASSRNSFSHFCLRRKRKSLQSFSYTIPMCIYFHFPWELRLAVLFKVTSRLKKYVCWRSGFISTPGCRYMMTQSDFFKEDARLFHSLSLSISQVLWMSALKNSPWTPFKIKLVSRRWKQRPFFSVSLPRLIISHNFRSISLN